MTKEQILQFNYCDNHLKDLNRLRDELPKELHGVQKYGCSSQSPGIERTLDRIHKELVTDIRKAFADSESKVQELIEKI